MTTISIHACKSVAIRRHTPSNDNAITLAIVHSEYGDDRNGHTHKTDQCFEVLLFGLPTAVTTALIETLSRVNAKSETEVV